MFNLSKAKRYHTHSSDSICNKIYCVCNISERVNIFLNVQITEQTNTWCVVYVYAQQRVHFIRIILSFRKLSFILEFSYIHCFVLSRRFYHGVYAQIAQWQFNNTSYNNNKSSSSNNNKKMCHKMENVQKRQFA